jgi:hypothetical protein
MKKNNLGSLSLAAALLVLAVQPVLVHAGTAPVSNVDELVAHHLDAVGPAQLRAGAKTRVAQGTAEFRILVGGAGLLEGKSVLVSEGPKFHFMMKFPNNDYKGEQFIFNGDRVEVSYATAQQSRSALGGFVFVQDAVIREGLWGGVLSTAWPLFDLDKRKAKLSFDGLKKVDGKDLYELRYQPKKNTDLEIHLYFDPETYRHVLTVYTLSVAIGQAGISQPGAGEGRATMGSLDNPVPTGTIPGLSNETAAARQQQTRYRLEERFDAFKSVDGLTLPTHYTIHFTQELQSGRTTVSEWVIQEADLADNTSLDPRNFDVK